MKPLAPKPLKSATKKTVVKQEVMAPPRDKNPCDKLGDDGLITMLDGIARDENHAPAVRTAAARAVMEARGELGKHQRAPGDGAARVPLSNASRPELEAELLRLRQQFPTLSKVG